MSYKDAVKIIVKSGGTVSFPFKTKVTDWYSDINITFSDYRGLYVVRDNRYGDEKFSDVDKAVDNFCQRAFSKKNVAIAFERMDARGIIKSKEDLEDLEHDLPKLRRLVKKYFDKYYDLEFKDNCPLV